MGLRESFRRSSAPVVLGIATLFSGCECNGNVGCASCGDEERINCSFVANQVVHFAKEANAAVNSSERMPDCYKGLQNMIQAQEMNADMKCASPASKQDVEDLLGKVKKEIRTRCPELSDHPALGKTK